MDDQVELIMQFYRNDFMMWLIVMMTNGKLGNLPNIGVVELFELFVYLKGIFFLLIKHLF